MSTNCIKCGIERRIGIVLYCEGCLNRELLHEWIDSLTNDELKLLYRPMRSVGVAVEVDPIDADDPDWYPIHTAAGMLNLNEGHLRRLCLEQLHKLGLAKKALGIPGARASWFVSRKFCAVRQALNAAKQDGNNLTQTPISARPENLNS